MRFGSAACTTRGFIEKEFILVGNYIADILHKFTSHGLDEALILCNKIKVEVQNLCAKYFKFFIHFFIIFGATLFLGGEH